MCLFFFKVGGACPPTLKNNLVTPKYLRLMTTNRAQIIKNNFLKNIENIGIKKLVKNKCISVAFMQKLEYAQSMSGRCVNVRSRGKLSSILLRNKKYGVTCRFLLNNPRLVILK